jgi:tRNA (mo5U34)-methyltransferase
VSSTSEPATTPLEEYFWWHSIDLGDGVVTPGRKVPAIMKAEFGIVFGPTDLAGKSVLDIGTWNGGFAVEAKRRGARHVLATDSYCWRQPMFRGRETFDLVLRRTGLDIEAREIDATEVGIDAVGRFDVVLFLGVFYHLLDPIAVVQRLAAVTDEVLVLETHMDAEEETRPAMVFYPGTELNGDGTNWWGPNRACVEALLRTVGFEEVVFTPGYAPGRGVFHAWKRKRPGTS